MTPLFFPFVNTPICVIHALLYMEHFKREALRSASNLFRFLFVDDTFVIQQQAHKQLFLD